jgi:glucose/arabinose dehydrogenase
MLFIGDVGGNICTSFEEINVFTPSMSNTANYGWPMCEGPCGNPNFPACPCSAGHINPWYSYAHNKCNNNVGSNSVTGGFVYRGSQLPSAYQGDYFFGDYGRNVIWHLSIDANNKPILPPTKFDDFSGGLVHISRAANVRAYIYIYIYI